MTSEYKNYGDASPLTQGGIWVKQIDSTTFDIIRNNPDDNTVEDLEVNITDSWIERESIMSYIGMTKDNFDPIEFAIGCINYYAPENFGAVYCDQLEADIIEFLKNRGIEVE